MALRMRAIVRSACVATFANTAWLPHWPGRSGRRQPIKLLPANLKKPKKAKAGLTLKGVRAWQLLQKKTDLADMLLDAAGEDEQLHSRLMLKAAAARSVNLATYRKVIDRAVGRGGFIDYYRTALAALGTRH